MTPGNTLSNEPSFVALSQKITKRPPVENCGIQLTQLFRVKTRDLQARTGALNAPFFQITMGKKKSGF
jgi:hypothetical protein